MRTLEVKLYEYAELKDEAKQFAMQEYREHQWEHGELLHFFPDICRDFLETEGFFDTNVTYSLSYSQGDGLSFSAERYDNLEELFIEVLGVSKSKTAKLISEQCDLIIKQNSGHYCYASKSDVDLYFDYSSENLSIAFPNIDEVVAKVLNLLEDKYMDLCNQLEKDGYAEIEYQDSDEAVIESIEDGKWY